MNENESRRQEFGVEQFFRRFETAAAESNSENVVSLYAPQFLFGGASGSRVMTRDELAAALRYRRAQADASGLATARLESTTETSINAYYTLATAKWVFSFGSAGGGPSKSKTATTTYLLRRDAGAISIIVQIDHDNPLTDPPR